MRKIFAFLMVSLDGYHSTVDGDLFWHNVDDEFNEFAAAQMDEADTLLFGRKTYLGMADFWTSPMALDVDPGMTKRMNDYPKVVVSRSVGSAEWPPVTLIRDDVVGQLGQLKDQPGKDIALLGSSTLAASLLGTGAIDELRIMVNPVVLGAGIPALTGADRTEQQLAQVRRFNSGNVLLTYQPA